VKKAQRFAELAWELLRELADETAYQRHLERRGCESSRAEWRTFSEKRLKDRYARPKCC
jgi:hypothetical protein